MAYAAGRCPAMSGIYNLMPNGVIPCWLIRPEAMNAKIAENNRQYHERPHLSGCKLSVVTSYQVVTSENCIWVVDTRNAIITKKMCHY